MDSGFKRLWSRKKSKDKRSNSVIDTRDSYPPNIPYSRSASVATHRQDERPLASYSYNSIRGNGYSSSPARQEPPVLAGSFLRPGTASRPPTSNSIQQAVDRAANTFDSSITQRQISSTRRTSFSSVKPPKSVDIFAVTQPQYAPPRPSFNEDVAERNRDGVRQTFLHISPSTSPLIPGDGFSENVASRNAPSPRSPPSRAQVRSPMSNFQEDVAARNAPPPLVPRRSMDVPLGARDRVSPHIGSPPSIHNVPRGLALQTKSPPPDRRNPASSPVFSSNRSINATPVPQSQNRTSPYAYGSPESDHVSGFPSTTSNNEYQSFYSGRNSNPASPVHVPLPERSSLRSVSRGEYVRVNGQITPAKSYRAEYGDFNLNIQSSPTTGALPIYAHIPGSYQLSTAEMTQTQGRSPIERQRAGNSTPIDRSLRPNLAGMRTNSGVSNASLKKHVSLPTRTIIDFTERETDSFAEGSEYGVDGTPIVEWAEADVMRLVHPAVVQTPLSPPGPGVKVVPSPISEEPPGLDNASRSHLVPRNAASTTSLTASLHKPVPPIPAPSSIRFSPISILASLPPGPIRKPDDRSSKSVLSTFIMNPAVTISPQRSSSSKPRDSAISSVSMGGSQIVQAPPKSVESAKENNRIDLTLPPASVTSKSDNRIDLTDFPEQLLMRDGRVDLTEEVPAPVVAPPASGSSLPAKSRVVDPPKIQQREVAHISDQLASVAETLASTVPHKADPISPTTVASSSKSTKVEQSQMGTISVTPGVHTRDFANFEATPATAESAESAPAPTIKVPDRHPSRPKSIQRNTSGDIPTKPQRMERGRSEDSVKRASRRGREDSKTVPRIAVYQSRFDDAEFARKREQANAALLRLQQSLDDADYQGSRPTSLSPSRTASPIAPRPNGVGVAAPPASSSKPKPQRVESNPTIASPMVSQKSIQTSSPRTASFHDIVTKGQQPSAPNQLSGRSEVRGPTLPSNPSQWKSKEKQIADKPMNLTAMTTDHFLDMALEPPRLLSDPNTRGPPSPGEVSLSSFPIPVSSPRTSKGSGEMAAIPLVRTHSQKSTAPSMMSSASMFSIPTHMIPDRSSSMRDQMVKEEEE